MHNLLYFLTTYLLKSFLNVFFFLVLQLTSSNFIGSELVCDHLKKKVHWIYLFVSSKYTEKLLIHGRIFEMFGRIPNLQKMLIFGRIFGRAEHSVDH